MTEKLERLVRLAFGVLERIRQLTKKLPPEHALEIAAALEAFDAEVAKGPKPDKAERELQKLRKENKDLRETVARLQEALGRARKEKGPEEPKKPRPSDPWRPDPSPWGPRNPDPWKKWEKSAS